LWGIKKMTIQNAHCVFCVVVKYTNEIGTFGYCVIFEVAGIWELCVIKKNKKMEDLRPNNQRAKYAIMLIWIVLTIDIMSLISSFFQYNLIQTVVNGGFISTEEANANDTREQIIGVIYMIVYIISAVTFIQWFRRAYFNLHLRANELSQSEGWAAGSWFVPFVNLYRPYQIMKELFYETKSLLMQNGISINDNFTSSSLGLWWTLWVTNNIVGNIVFKHSLKAESIDELTLSTIGSMIVNVIGIPLAIVTIRIIKDYSRVEPLLIEIKTNE
jgi:hypothetical protein